MADVYLYADETGNLDYDIAGKQGATPCFGFGSVVFDGPHADALWRGLALRAEVEARSNVGSKGMPRGFHAVDDSNLTRSEVFQEISSQAPRFDATLLLKSAAYAHVKAAGEMRLYQMAWYLHLKYLAPKVAKPGDRLFVIVATLGTASRRTQARAALNDVCQQTGIDYVLCQWDSAPSWGLQVADYCLWSVQRREERRSGTWWEEYIRPFTASVFFPWGQHSTPLRWD